jgi:hypothetical protein
MSGIQNVSVSASQSYASVSTQAQQSLAPFGNLNLTEAQRTQLRSIFSAAKADGTSRADVQKEVNGVLTPAQQQTLASDIKPGGSHFGHRKPEDSGSTTQTSATSDASAEPASSASPDATILDVVTNIQKQAVAAKSTLIDNLQQRLLATDGEATTS